MAQQRTRSRNSGFIQVGVSPVVNCGLDKSVSVGREDVVASVEVKDYGNVLQGKYEVKDRRARRSEESFTL